MGTVSKLEVGRTLKRFGPTSATVDWFTRHSETIVIVQASPKATFSFLDDHTRLAAHMSKRSWMMAGSRMSIEMDDAQGHEVGSTIRLSGRLLGLSLRVDEVVTERNPPARKVWHTTGTPRLLIIGSYRMGYSIESQAGQTRLRVFIDYALPDGYFTRWLGRLLGDFYARWCTDRMAHDAANHFGSA